MTAINVIQQTNAIHVVTDGLIQGRPFLVSKVWTLPHLSAALTITGGDRSFSLLGKLAYEASTAYGQPEYLFANLPKLIRECQTKYAGAVPLPHRDSSPDHFMAVLAAYIAKPCKIGGASIQAGPLAGFVASHAVGDVPAYSLILRPQLKQVWLCPDVPPIPQECAAQFGGRDLDAIDVDAVAAGCIEIQRRKVQPEFPNAIGGFAQLTTITETDVRSRIVKRWPVHLTEAGGWEDEIL